MLQKAASAAYTYLVIHPKDDMMLKNLKYYSKMESVDMREIVNFEADVRKVRLQLYAIIFIRFTRTMCIYTLTARMHTTTKTGMVSLTTWRSHFRVIFIRKTFAENSAKDHSIKGGSPTSYPQYQVH